MLKIRLHRVGKKHDPSFRVVLTDSRRAASSGKAIEVLGFYNAQKDQIKLSGDKIKDWITKGAQVSDTVHNLLVREKVIKGPKINVLPSQPKKEEPTKTGAEVAQSVAAEPKAEEKPVAEPAEAAK